MMAFVLIIFMSLSAWAESELNLELGTVKNTYNQVQIPGDEGTRFNLASSLSESSLYHRVSFSHKFQSPHGFRLLYAPLRLTGDNVYEKDITFQGVSFNANQRIDTEYQFNSYRASYFYQLVDQKNWILRLGGTLKIRDAKVKLTQGDHNKFKKNSGIVPLIYLFTEYRWDNGFRIAFDFDGLIAPQGRAFDMALMGGYYFSSNLHLNIGARMLEGGADNDTVYNFSQLNFLFTSLQLNF
jgi:hypothetical protein